jgi:hypothetical protein
MGSGQELNFVGLYPNPYLEAPNPPQCTVATVIPKPSPQAERAKVQEMLKESTHWEPDSNDFIVVMDQSNAADPRLCPSVVHLIAAMYSFVYKPDGTRRGPRIEQVNILTHGNPQSVGFLGTVSRAGVDFCTSIGGPKKWHDLSLRGPKDSPTARHFTALDLDFIDWLNGAGEYKEDRAPGIIVTELDGKPVKRGDGLITPAELRGMFSKEGGIYLYACSAGTSEHVGGPPDPGLVNGIANLFGCRVTGFNDLIKFTVPRDRLSLARPTYKITMTLSKIADKITAVTDFHQLVDRVRRADASLLIERPPRR